MILLSPLFCVNYELKHIDKGNKSPSSENNVKFVLLLILIGVIVPVFAQEQSFEDQYVSSEEYAKLIDKLDQIEENLRTILENQFDNSEEHAKLMDRLDSIENNGI